MLAQEKLQEITPLTREQLAELMPSAQGLLSDEPEMEHSLHALQLLILVSCLTRIWQDRNDYFLSWNLTVYYSRDQLKTKDFHGPDLFLVKGVENRPRPSWVVWEEGGKYPDLIIELLSESTAKVDRGEKRELYERIFRTPEYFYYSPETQEFMGLRLRGEKYEEIEPTEQGWRWSEMLELYLGIHNQQLRYFFPMVSWCLLLKKLRESRANVLSKSGSGLNKNSREQITCPEVAGARGGSRYLVRVRRGELAMTNPNPITEVLDPVYLPELPPTQDELPYDDGEPMESWRHRCQMDLLISTTQTWLQQRPDGFVGGNMFLYYSLEQTRGRNFKGPDYFVVLGVPKGERKSWVIWEQGKGPDVVIELLSPSTAQEDKTSKKQLYEQIIRVPEYFWFDPFEPEDWAGFRLRGGRYEPIQEDAEGCLPSEVLGLYLVKWEGRFRDIEATWIRWATAAGELVPTEAELERQRAEQAEQRAGRLARKLQELGVDPDAL